MLSPSKQAWVRELSGDCMQKLGSFPLSQKTYMTSCLLNSRQIVDSSLGCLLLHNVCYFAIAGILVQRRQADFKTISALLAVRRWGRQPRVAHTSSVHGRWRELHSARCQSPGKWWLCHKQTVLQKSVAKMLQVLGNRYNSRKHVFSNYANVRTYMWVLPKFSNAHFLI